MTDTTAPSVMFDPANGSVLTGQTLASTREKPAEHCIPPPLTNPRSLKNTGLLNLH